MKVFVTGSTGYIGSAVCDALKAQGHAILALARSPEKINLLQARGYQAVLGDLNDPSTLAAGCASADAVIHTAMQYDGNSGALDRAAVEAMLGSLTGTGKPFIYTSGVWVMGDTRGRMLGEVSVLRPPTFVAWRPAVEELVMATREKGVKSMVFRPGMVFGRKGGAPGQMFKEAREHGIVHFIGDGENHWSCVHADDLADLYARAVAEPAPGELFIACGGMPQPVRKIALAVAKASGIEGKIEGIPVETARQQMGSMADCLAMDSKVGSTKAARFFGWTVRHPSIFEEIFSGSYAAN